MAEEMPPRTKLGRTGDRRERKTVKGGDEEGEWADDQYRAGT